MTTREEVFIGVDVCKAELVMVRGDRVQTIVNNKTSIVRWLRTLPPQSCIGLEATGSYHLLLADLAHAQGMRVYVLNPRQVLDYRKSLGGRAKTDLRDAKVIARFVEREHKDLHPYVPLTSSQRKLVSLLRRRTKVVQAKVALRQSLGSLPAELLKEAGMAADWKSMQKRLDQLIEKFDTAIDDFLQQCELGAAATRLRTISGVGAVTSAALLAALGRGEFASADAFVAFLGLDLKVDDSGQHTGRRRLSKRGDSYTRALLYTAAMSAVKTKTWRDIYKAYLKRGLKKIQALIIIARRIARAAWSMLKNNTDFSSQRLCKALT
jgi:transposase